MSGTKGRSVRLFLVEGTASGLTTAEIMNWTGHVLSGARSGLPGFLKRPELDRTGIYFLFGPDPDEPDLPRVYIGESDSVRNRLSQHNKDSAKDFWERSCVVTSKDQNITKAHARYLEARLITIAAQVGRAVLANGTAPPAAPLPEADQSDMEFFIEQIRLILPVLGFEFLRQRPTASLPRIAVGESESSPVLPAPSIAESPLFELAKSKHALSAEARQVDGEFIVLAGSLANPEWMTSSTAQSGYAKRHGLLIKQGKLVPDPSGKLRFTEDTAFASPSAASAVILGRNDNGRTSWRIKGNGITYAEWQEQLVAEAEAISDAVPGEAAY